MPVIADRIVKIDQSLARHQLFKPPNQFIWTRRLHSKIRAGKRKQNREIHFTKKNRIQSDSRFRGMAQAKSHRQATSRLSLTHCPADQISAVSPIKNAADHFQ